MKRIAQSFIMQDNKTKISARHWLRDLLTLLAEAFIWTGCFYVVALLYNIRKEAAPLPVWLTLYAWGFVFLLVATRFIPNNAYSRTARRDEVVAQAMKTVLFVCVLALAAFTERNSHLYLPYILFFLALTIERLVLNSWFIRYSMRHNEHGIIICNDNSAWQQKALMQNTYGRKLAR